MLSWQATLSWHVKWGREIRLGRRGSFHLTFQLAVMSGLRGKVGLGTTLRLMPRFILELYGVDTGVMSEIYSGEHPSKWT